MKRTMFLAVVLSGLAMLFAAGSCATWRGRAAADYYPLRKGATWTYRATSYADAKPAESVINVVRVVEAENGEFIVRQGEDVHTFVLSPQGVAKKKTGAFILKEPLEKGGQWEIDVSGKGMRLSGKAVVVEKGVPLDVSGTSYSDCLTVEERYDSFWRRVASYCPGVGLVKEEFFETEKGAEKLLRKAELLAHEAGAE